MASGRRFSVTLNSPYAGDRPRGDVIEPVLDLYRRFRSEPWVRADDLFLRVVEEGAPSRPWLEDIARA